jgi:hypothetical protein
VAFRWNPISGAFDYTNAMTADSSTYLIINRIASENILKTEVLSYTPIGQMKLANNNTTADDAFVVGVAMNNALAGQSVDVLLMGIINDPIFNVFPLNATIYLDINGGSTDIKPTLPGASSWTIVGRSYGNGEVFVNPSRPVFL